MSELNLRAASLGLTETERSALLERLRAYGPAYLSWRWGALESADVLFVSHLNQLPERSTPDQVRCVVLSQDDP
jgi:hypothetical protein